MSSIGSKSTEEIYAELQRRKEAKEAKAREALVALLILPLSWLLEACVVTKLWTWFVSGPFGVRTIGMAHAFGLCVMISYATHKTKTERSDPKMEKSPIELIREAVVMTLFYLLIGWVAHGLMP